ncbi:hypothetical protein [Roseibium sp. MMSF_3412]|uniref:hypothetical protein n=1 Tax=Roseibium sp. MMSF_3412 TaxID=3046712 RepID=UPI00273F7E91|nr:hypothetical protein [Roseibium sp. MMSF_3412]
MSLIRGLGRERGFQTFICVVILFANVLIASLAISTLGDPDETGDFRFTAQAIPIEYYLYLALSMGFGLVSMWSIRFPDPQGRWGARLFCSLLVPAFLLLFTLNMKIFSWAGMLETILS